MRSHFLRVLFIILAAVSIGRAVELGPMTWTPRSDWIDARDCTALTHAPNAIGDGSADDTAAIQGALDFITQHGDGHKITLYFPKGTYKISKTLTLTNVSGGQMIGCGSATTLIWAGEQGGAMFRPSNCSFEHYWGLTWDGANLASCAFEYNADVAGGEYETQIRHENETFKNFTAVGTYTFQGPDKKPMTGAPAAAMIEAFPQGGITADALVFNCRFVNCSMGLFIGYHFTQVFQWHLSGCQFEDCGIGFNGGSGYGNVIDNTHFERSTTADVSGGGTLRMRFCTSSKSGAFFLNGQGTNVLQDCQVDGWTNPSGAVEFVGPGSHAMFDCTFTNGPANAKGVIHALGYKNPENILLSNNTAVQFPAGAGLINNESGCDNRVVVVPAGQRKPGLTASTVTFLKTKPVVDSPHILDVTQDPFYADPTAKTDASSAVQDALNAAAAAHNGSIVYFPIGRYRLQTTLKATGSNYTIQGAGLHSELVWFGESGAPLLTLVTPKDVTVQNLGFAPEQNSKASPAIVATATEKCAVMFDGIFYNWVYDPPLAEQSNNNNPGVVLQGLPAGSTVYIPYLPAPLTIKDCGAATIFGRNLMGGAINVSGAETPQGFTGILDLENIEQEDKAGYVISLKDNASLVVGDHYTESDYNNVSLTGSTSAQPGRFTIQGANDALLSNSISLNIENYNGRVYFGNYAMQNLAGPPGTSDFAPVKIIQTGTAPLRLILAGLNTLAGPPTVTVDPSVKLVQILGSNHLTNGAPLLFPDDTPKPLDKADLAAIAASLDDLRELEQLDLSVESGN